MKSINELCNEYGVSRQTIYNAVKKTGRSIEELTVETQGNKRLFTDEGVKLLQSALSKNLSKREKPVKTVNETVKKLRETIEKQSTEINNLTVKLTAQAEELDKRAQEAEELRREVASLREDNALLIRTNATNAVTIQSLQASKEKTLLPAERTGRIARAWRILTGKEID